MIPTTNKKKVTQVTICHAGLPVASEDLGLPKSLQEDTKPNMGLSLADQLAEKKMMLSK